MKIFNKLTKIVTKLRSTARRDSYDFLRDSERYPKCYDMTEQERQAAIVRLNRNVWNDYSLSKQDYYKLNRPSAK